MSYGQEFRIDNLGRGLASNISEADMPPGGALVEENIELTELGAIRKRNGIVRFIPQEFLGDVTAVIPVSDCLGSRWYIVGSDELRVAKR